MFYCVTGRRFILQQLLNVFNKRYYHYTLFLESVIFDVLVFMWSLLSSVQVFVHCRNICDNQTRVKREEFSSCWLRPRFMCKFCDRMNYISSTVACFPELSAQWVSECVRDLIFLSLRCNVCFVVQTGWVIDVVLVNWLMLIDRIVLSVEVWVNCPAFDMLPC